MALKLNIPSGERVIIGNAVIFNPGDRVEILVENEVPVLRSRDVMSILDIKTPCDQLYFTVQLAYLEQDHNLAGDKIKQFWSIAREIVNAAPSLLVSIDEIAEHLFQGRFYQALKSAKKLRQAEEELLKNV